MSESNSIVSKLVWKALEELCRVSTGSNWGDEREEQAEEASETLETPANPNAGLKRN